MGWRRRMQMVEGRARPAGAGGRSRAASPRARGAARRLVSGRGRPFFVCFLTHDPGTAFQTLTAALSALVLYRSR